MTSPDAATDPTRPHKGTYLTHRPHADVAAEVEWLWRELQARVFAPYPQVHTLSWRHNVLYNDNDYDFEVSLSVNDDFEVYDFDAKDYVEDPGLEQYALSLYNVHLAHGRTPTDAFGPDAYAAALPDVLPDHEGERWTVERDAQEALLSGEFAWMPEVFTRAHDVLLNLWEAHGYYYFIRLFGLGACVTVTRAGVEVTNEALVF